MAIIVAQHVGLQVIHSKSKYRQYFGGPACVSILLRRAIAQMNYGGCKFHRRSPQRSPIRPLAATAGGSLRANPFPVTSQSAAKTRYGGVRSATSSDHSVIKRKRTLFWGRNSTQPNTDVQNSTGRAAHSAHTANGPFTFPGTTRGILSSRAI